MRWSAVFLFATIFVGGAMVWLGQVDESDLENIAAPQAGAVAPAFELIDLDGQLHTLDEFKGRPLVLNFWATWCPPCRAEMPALQKVYDDYKDEGLVIIAINVQENPAVIQTFIEDYGLTFPVLLDTTAATSRAYEQEAFPSTYFIDRDGRVADTAFGGPMSEAFIESMVRRIIKK